MQPKLIILFSLCYFSNIKTLWGQTRHAQKILVDTTMKDTFAFNNNWAYAWYIEKDDSGKFHTDYNEAITSTDTTHLFFTTNCETNVQGGYTVRYCYASQKGKTIKLDFDCVLPLYGNQYYAYIKNDSFYFEPKINYPASYIGEKLTYVVNKETITLNKRSYALGDTIIGYIDCTFTEHAVIPNKKPYTTKFWFKGYFCTPFKMVEEPRR